MICSCIYIISTYISGFVNVGPPAEIFIFQASFHYWNAYCTISIHFTKLSHSTVLVLTCTIFSNAGKLCPPKEKKSTVLSTDQHSWHINHPLTHISQENRRTVKHALHQLSLSVSESASLPLEWWFLCWSPCERLDFFFSFFFFSFLCLDFFCKTKTRAHWWSPCRTFQQLYNNNNEYFERLTAQALSAYMIFTNTYCQNSTHTTWMHAHTQTYTLTAKDARIKFLYTGNRWL